MKPIHKIAELMCGGIVVLSEYKENGNIKKYAKTTVQLDGDVVTAFLSDVVKRKNFKELAQRHFEEVTMSLGSLKSVGQMIRRVTSFTRYGILFSEFIIFFNKYPEKNILAFQPLWVTVLAALLFLASLVPRRIFHFWVKQKAGSLLKDIRKETEEEDRKRSNSFSRL